MKKSRELFRPDDGLLKNHRIIKVVFMAMLLLWHLPVVQAQPKAESHVVKGRVTDETGQSIPGVNVIVQELQNGVITDANGYYTIVLPSSTITLTYTFIGYEKQSVKVNGRSEINVQLVTEVSQLGDVVVTGYFKQTKESFTGAAVTISSAELMQANNQNILQAIGLVDPSFMQVENIADGSNPNVMPDFQIRGAATIDMQSEYDGNPNMPTFILDGFEVSSEKVFDLDPYRVRSVTILKDAAATAIYGSRAANGVVVIETNAPKDGKIEVSYNGDFTFTGADLSDYDLLNAREKLDVEVAAGLYATSGVMSNVESITERYNDKLKLVQQGYNTYWLNKPVEKLSMSSKHSLLLEGGSNEIRYAIDLNYNGQNGVMKESGRDRLGVGVKLQYTYKNLILKNKLTYDYVNAYNSPYGSFSTYAKLNPYYRYQDDDGKYLYVLETTSSGSSVFNPLYNTTLNMIDENGYDNLIDNFDLDWRLNDEFRIKGSFSVNKSISSSDAFKSGNHTSFASVSDFNKKGSYQATRGESLSWTSNLVLNYFKQANKHVINANAIYNINETKREGFTIKAEGFPNDDMDNIDFAIQYDSSSGPSGYEYTSRLMGFSGNANYSYDNRFLADVSGRMDGSSAFGSDKRWAPFWALGAGWNMHNESFMKQLSFIDRFKIRGSYGSTGSVNYDPYQSMMMYKYRTDAIHHFETGAVLMGLGNDQLSWQQTLKRNIGLDFEMFKKKFSGNINYYSDLSKNLLTDIDLAPSLGFTTYKENLGESKNQGLEMTLRYNIMKQKDGVNWSVHASLVRNQNTLLKLSDSLKGFNESQDEEMDQNTEEATTPRVRYVEGQSMTAIWANKSLGIDPATGKEVFVTKDGGTDLVWSTDNIMICGDTNPEFYGTFGTNFSYKGFMMNMIFRYSYGGQTYNSTLVSRVENADPEYNVDRRFLEARWQNPGDITFYKDIKDETYTKATSRFIQDYSYLQLASVNASYEFDKRIAEKVGMKRLKMTFYMSDIFRLSTVKQERGTSYPFSRSFSVGIQGRF